MSSCYSKFYFNHSDDRNVCCISVFDIAQDAPKSFSVVVGCFLKVGYLIEPLETI